MVLGPPKKRARTATQSDDKVPPADAGLLADERTAWLVASDEPPIEIKVKDETLKAHGYVLRRHSEYFETCLKGPYKEADGVIRFDDIEPKYMALYIGVAYSFSTMVPHASPLAAQHPETQSPRTTLHEYVEVYKLCDRFISPKMTTYVTGCINIRIGDGHRALFRSVLDKAQQKALMKDFADAYEALEQAHPLQKELAERIIEYFVQGVNYDAWDACMEEVMDRPRFVAQVSKGFARKLAEAVNTRSKLKRKELSGP